MKIKLVLFVLLLLCAQSALAQDKPSIPEIDRVRIAEAYRLSEAVGDRVWKGWSKAPFALLLVTPGYEFLIRHPHPSEDFTLLGYDKLLKSDVYFRKRVYQTGLLATFPAIKGSMTPTIVVGEAEHTMSKTSTPWVVTLLHEHFHQFQYSQPTYYEDVKSLNLAHGDQGGMWMLNYAFPYDRREVQDQFAALSKLLAEAVSAEGRADREAKIATYLQARREFQQSLNGDDYRYLSFQLWQEGIARYTEYRVAKLAALDYKPGKEFRALPDFTPFAQVADALRERILKQLQAIQLGELKREVAYPFGAAEGLLLDTLDPRWQSRYFVDKFDLSRYYARTK